MHVELLEECESELSDDALHRLYSHAFVGSIIASEYERCCVLLRERVYRARTPGLAANTTWSHESDSSIALAAQSFSRMQAQAGMRDAGRLRRAEDRAGEPLLAAGIDSPLPQGSTPGFQ